MSGTIVWGIDGSVSGHAGARVTFSLGPYIGTPDNAEIQSVVVGLGELLASQGQYVTHAQVNAVRHIGDRVLDRAIDAQRAVGVDVARGRNEEYWQHLDEHIRSVMEQTPMDLDL